MKLGHEIFPCGDIEHRLIQKIGAKVSDKARGMSPPPIRPYIHIYTDIALRGDLRHEHNSTYHCGMYTSYALNLPAGGGGHKVAPPLVFLQ